MNCYWNQCEKLPAQEILPGSGAELHLGSYFTDVPGVSATRSSGNRVCKQEQGSWHAQACLCRPEVLLKTVQDCSSQHNGGSDIQQDTVCRLKNNHLCHIRGLMTRLEIQLKVLMCLSVQPGLKVTLVSPVRCEGEQTV